MPRNYQKKGDRVRKTPEEIEAAVIEIVVQGQSVRSVAKEYGIGKSYLARKVLECKQGDPNKFKHNPNIGNRRVFSAAEESELAKYLIKASKMNYGLTTVQTRKLAYEYALLVKSKTMPRSWHHTKQASADWMTLFLKRNDNLSIRTPEATSLSRATSFNAANVATFYEKLEQLLHRYEFTPDRIYNCDETGITTVHKPPNIIAQRDEKQVSQVTSGERGQLVTMLNFVNAIGNALPPVFIFPRVNFKEFMLNGAPPESLGLAYKTGWMTSDNFLLSLQHFVKFSGCSVDNPVLLLLDNSETHLTIEIIKYCKENGIILLTLTPHCSHRLQPLDVGVYSPFKGRYNIAADNWMTNNPGKTLTIYNVAELAGTAFTLAMSRSNIQAGFMKTVIYPFNKDIFGENDFLSSSVTDRPNPSTSRVIESLDHANDPQPISSSQAMEQAGSSRIEPMEMQTIVSLRVDTSAAKGSGSAINISNQLPSPELLRPFPKAPPRKGSLLNRRKGSSRILTDTPEKEKIEREMLEKEQKKTRAVKRVSKTVKTPMLPAKRKLPFETFSSSRTQESDSESDDDSFVASSSSEELSAESSDHEIEFQADKSDIQPGDFVLVKYVGKSSIVYYVGRVLENVQTIRELEVKFLRKRATCWKFFYPEVDDISIVDMNNVITKLPPPAKQGGTERVLTQLQFPVNLSSFNVR